MTGPPLREGPVLVALGFSTLSDRALDLALEWAAALRREVHLVHFIEAPFEPWESARDQLELREGRAEERGVRCTSRLVDRGAELSIADVAHSVGASLIAMGTHARSGLKRAVLGSRAEHTLRHADCPVVALNPDAACPAAVRTVVVGLDASPAALAALEAVRALLRATGPARVLLVHAATGPPDPAARGDAEREALPVPDRGAVEARLRPQLDALTADGCDAELVVRNRAAATLILETAAREEADLVALGTHGRSGLERALLGSVALQVLREAKCPVLVTRGGD